MMPDRAAQREEIISCACVFVEIATPFFEKYKSLIPTSLAGYFTRLRAACDAWRKDAAK